MTEQRMENAMEQFGGAVETTVEGAAAVLDRSMDRMWGFRPVRFAGRALTLAAGAGLMASSVPLKEKGYHKAAKACLIGGGVIVEAQILELALIRRD